MASISQCFFYSHSFSRSRTFQTLNPPSLSLKPNQTLSPTPHLSLRPLRWPARALIRASTSNADVWTAEIRPGGAVESDRIPADVRRRAMDAVDACGRRVTVGDVTSKAGIKVDEAQKVLQALAADTAGFLEVSDEGDVLYVFEKDYRLKLVGKSFRLKIEPVVDKAKSVGDYLVRVLFGTTLIASVVIVFTAIMILLIALITGASDKDEKKSKSSGVSFSNINFNFLFSGDDYGWRSSESSSSFSLWYLDPNYYRRQQMQKKKNELNFLESVFSFVFGDGDSNQGLEEKRWKLIAEYIETNGGVVAAEELAVYLDIKSTEELGDDSFILPVLLRFDGQPEVNEEGNILYRFPSLQRTASPQKCGKNKYVKKKGAEFVGGLEKFFKENKLNFSKASSSQRTMVIGLGAFNLTGVNILGIMLKNIAVTRLDSLHLFTRFFPSSRCMLLLFS